MSTAPLIGSLQDDHRDVVKEVQEGDHRMPEEEAQITGVATAQQDSTRVFPFLVFLLQSKLLFQFKCQPIHIFLCCSESFDAELPIDPQTMDR